MNICNANYNIKFMSGENKKITFFYLLDFEMKNFKISFVTELRKQFKDKDETRKMRSQHSTIR